MPTLDPAGTVQEAGMAMSGPLPQGGTVTPPGAATLSKVTLPVMPPPMATEGALVVTEITFGGTA
ncbi:MAG TPA: hypothetical protein VGL56_04935 [Fimbriimonadaceae bacterium]